MGGWGPLRGGEVMCEEGQNGEQEDMDEVSLLHAHVARHACAGPVTPGRGSGRIKSHHSSG